jgi:hypothetical protein
MRTSFVCGTLALAYLLLLTADASFITANAQTLTRICELQCNAPREKFGTNHTRAQQTCINKCKAAKAATQH